MQGRYHRIWWLTLLFLHSYHCYDVESAASAANENNSIQSVFVQSFIKRCSKYAFVNKYIASLESPHLGRYVIFTYHSPELRNGGFGDRQGGI